MDRASFESELRSAFSGCDDFTVRHTDSGAEVCFLMMGVDRSYVSENLIRPLRLAGATRDTIEVLGVTPCESVQQAVFALLHGCAAVLFPDGECVVCAADRSAGRSVSQPDTEVTVYGAHNGFVEALDVNLAMIRRSIRIPQLKIEYFTLGRLTSANVAMLYVEGTASKRTVDYVRNTLKEAKLRSALDSGYVANLFDRGTFAASAKSEKCSRVCARLLDGRIAVIVDGNPFVVTVPYVFTEALQCGEDYIKSSAYSTFIRALRFFALLISLYLPAVFTAAVYSRTRLLPLGLMMSVTDSGGDVAFGIFGELVVSLVIFEIVREVGQRMPRAVGDSVGLLASIILGDAAVKAGLAGAVAIMIAALSAVCSFAVPVFKDPSVLLRFLLLFASFALSFTGIAIVTLAIVSVMLMTESCGTPYLTPASPLSLRGLCDMIISLPRRNIQRGDEGISEDE